MEGVTDAADKAVETEAGDAVQAMAENVAP